MPASLFKNLQLVVLVIYSLTISGQDVHYSNYHENLFRVNPAAYAEISFPTLSMNYRNQWPGSTNFVTYDAAFLGSLPNYKSSVALLITQDVQGAGIINTTVINLGYAYTTKIGRKTKISAGLSGGYNFETINTNLLTFENAAAYSNLAPKNNYFDFGTGILMNNDSKNYFGASLLHLVNSSKNEIPKTIGFNYWGNYLLWGNPSFQFLKLQPLFIFRWQGIYQELYYGARINYNGLYAGLYTRQDFQFNFSDISLLLGINLEKFQFVYTYDINLLGADGKFDKLAAHEVTFLYKFEYKNKFKKKGAIKCPKF